MARGLYVVDQLPPIDVTSRAAFTTFTTFADIYGTPQKILPKSRMDVGLTLELYAAGEFSTTGTPTMSAGFYFNGAPSTAPTTLVAPTSILGQTQLAVSGGTTQVSAPWQAYWRGTLRAIGTGATGGTWKGQGFARFGNTTTPFVTDVSWPIPTTLALRTVTCDVTSDQEIGPGWQWGTSAASNSVTVDEFVARCGS
jgi:hypothetical protein